MRSKIRSDKANPIQSGTPPALEGAAPHQAVGRGAWRRELLLVASASFILQIIAALDAGLWYMPDSASYLSAAYGTFRHMDFANEYYAYRTPGYPLLLAGLMALFDGMAPTALLVLQHGLAVAMAVMTLSLGRRLGLSRFAALFSALSVALSWSLACYANVVLTETLFAALVLAWLAAVLRWMEQKRWPLLATISVLAGAAAMVRPIGTTLIPLTWLAAMAGLIRYCRGERIAGVRPRAFPFSAGSGGAGSQPGPPTPIAPLCGLKPAARHRLGPARFAWWTILAGWSATAILPGGLMVWGWSEEVRLVHGIEPNRGFGGKNLYLRLVTLDRMSKPRSPALDELQRCAAIVSQGDPTGRVWDYLNEEQAMVCYRKVHGASRAEAYEVLGEAARTIFRARWPTVLRNTPTHLKSTLLHLDDLTRYRPDDAVDTPAAGFSTREPYEIAWQQLYGVDEAFPFDPPWVRGPTTSVAGFMTGANEAWTWQPAGTNRLLIDNAHELWMLLAFAGICAGVLTLRTPSHRRAWGGVGLLLASQLGPSCFLVGANPRFVVPFLPLLCLGVGRSLDGLAWAIARWGFPRPLPAPPASVQCR